MFENIEDQWTGADQGTVSEAVGFQRFLDEPMTIMYLEFFNTILTHVDGLFQTLQRRCIDATEVQRTVEKFGKSVQEVQYFVLFQH